MARPPTLTAGPAADSAALLRRLGFLILMMALPVAALFARRAIVVLAPMGVILLVIAAVLDGGSRPVRSGLTRVVLSPAGLAGGLVLGWCALSLVWTPFPAEASERLFNIIGALVLALAGYLALPDRMRSANLYILPVGVAIAALLAVAMAFVGSGSETPDEDGQNLERGLIVLVLFLWPAVAWLRSRGRHFESLVLAIVVAVATLLGPHSFPLQALAAGALVFAVAAVDTRIGAMTTATVMAGLLLLAPAVPFLIRPLAAALLGNDDPLVDSINVWASVVADEPVRLITGHGFETALRARFVGLLSPNAPNTLLFEIWYELGIVGAAAAAVALYLSARDAARDHPPLVPGVMAAFATAFAFACLGIGTAQVWWLTTLIAVIVIFVAAERGQFRTARPKAMLLRTR
jgi:hypothetical protein